jgi:hypothetical protein
MMMAMGRECTAAVQKELVSMVKVKDLTVYWASPPQMAMLEWPACAIKGKAMESMAEVRTLLVYGEKAKNG